MAVFDKLVVDGIRKRMGAVQALDGISLAVGARTVHGVIGHNGSGKSTLVKVLSGVLAPDSGTYAAVEIDESGGAVHRPPRVATVYQDLGLADNLTVFENLLVNSFQGTTLGYVSIRRERQRALAVTAALGLDLPLDVPAYRLREPERVMLCVARALIHGGIAVEGDAGSAGVDVLLLDEPTSSLPRDELERFRRLVRHLRERSRLAILIVTHNPGDIGAMCDELTALKGGRVLSTMPVAGTTLGELAELMAGKALAEAPVGRPTMNGTATPGSSEGSGDAAFVVDALATDGLNRPVSLTVRRGQLVGITGLEGSGFREFIESAMGIKQAVSGTVHVGGKRLERGPAGLSAAGAVYIASDRARTSGIPAATAYENMTLGRLDPFCRRGFINVKKERAAVTEMLRKLRVDPPDPERSLMEMSGGQQQKVVVGRALLSGASLLVFEEPTAAVDVGARGEILSYLHAATRNGSTVVIASAEFEWMGEVCDRIIVFRSGDISGELQGDGMTEAAILQLAYGE